MPKKADFSRKILNSLAGKRAVSLPDIKAEAASASLPGSKSSKKVLPAETYAITRSLKNLADTGLIERLESGQGEYARLTPKGRQKVASLKLDSSNALANPNWDGKWRIVLLDRLHPPQKFRLGLPFSFRVSLSEHQKRLRPFDRAHGHRDGLARCRD